MTEFVRGTTLTPQHVCRPHFVYSAWDASGTCLYVGCTNNEPCAHETGQVAAS